MVDFVILHEIYEFILVPILGCLVYYILLSWIWSTFDTRREPLTSWERFKLNRNHGRKCSTSDKTDKSYESEHVSSPPKRETQINQRSLRSGKKKGTSWTYFWDKLERPYFYSGHSVDFSFISPRHWSYLLQRTSPLRQNQPLETQMSNRSQKTKLKKRLKVKYVKRHRDPEEKPVTETNDPETCKQKDDYKHDKEFYSLMWQKVDQLSHQPVKTRFKVESEGVFHKIVRRHLMFLVCKECVGLPDPLEAEEHECRRNKLILSRKRHGGTWKEVYNIPKGYSPNNSLCDLKLKCGRRSRCNFPHSMEEWELWRILSEHKWSLDGLVEDMQKSNITLEYAVENVSQDVKAHIVCKICLKKKNYDRFLKAKKKPECRNGHRWKGNHTLVVEILGEANENKRYVEIKRNLDCSSLDHLSEEARLDVQNMKLLLVDGFSLDEIARAFHQFKQRKRVESLKKTTDKKARSSNETDGDREEHDESDQFDTCFDDILEEINVDKSEVEHTFRREAIANIKPDHRYYELFPYEELDDLLESDPDKYRLCEIKLDGSQKAVCTALDDGLKIEIKGRQNCGPTANGDIVVVEIKKEEVLDAEWKKKEGTKEEELQMTRGTVVGIKAQNCNRRSYNFVCTVDEYFSHLMMPICGTIPKIHCDNGPIKFQPDAVKNRKVCVYQGKGQGRHLSHIMQVNRKNIHDKLFVVNYEQWGITHIYSRGYVVKVIKPGLNLEDGQRVLDLMYQVPPDYSDHVKKTLQVKYESGIPKSLMEDREDFTELNIFSIDPPQCQDVDDALSVKVVQNSKGCKEIYEVGIHISDVTAFLVKNEELDKRAAMRKISFYPQHGQPKHMLPDKLSRYLCSLRRGEVRLTISVFVQLDKSGKLLNKPKFQRGIVKNQRQLTYAEAEVFISGEESDFEGNPQIPIDIRTLHGLAKGLRRERIGRQCYFKETEISFDRNHDMSKEAHMLIEEFMILANSLVASHLVEELPRRTLVRSQTAPSEDALKTWVKQNDLALHGGFLFHNRANTIDDHREKTELKNGQTVNILLSSFKMLSNQSQQDINKLQSVIEMEKMHPTLAVGYSSWLDLQTRAKVHRHEDKESSYHFSLKKDYYAWFTSPIRRYMDIIIHRLLLYVMDKDDLKDIPYTAEEIDNFSKEFNHGVKRSRNHSKASTVLQMSCNLKCSNAVVPAFVGNFDEDGVTFELPYLPQIKKRNRKVNYSLLGVSDKPEIEDNHFTLFWQRRLYNTILNRESARTESMVTQGIVTKLNHEKHIRKIPCENWQELQELSIQQDGDELPSAIERMVDASIPHNFQSGLFDDVTSEMKDSFPIIKHHAKFSLKVETGFALPVQLGTTVEKGMLMTAVNLIEVSRTIHICTEHASDPVKCFADIATARSKPRYRDITEYKNIWLPILEMESATNAISEGDPITIHNVPVNIKRVNNRYDGHLELHKDFCNHRHIKFFSTKKLTDEESQDYLCLRFPYQDNLSALPEGVNESFLASHFQHDSVWVAHAQALHASIKKKDELVRLEFTVNQNCSPHPKNVKYDALQNCTVEFIAKTLPDRRMKNAVEMLEEANALSKTIILGRALTPNEHTIKSDSVPNVKDIKVKKVPYPLPANNKTQTNAIEHALKHTFTIIQGPPGTGKTLTGVKLVYWFDMMNKHIPAGSPKRQVMYCGPSNSAVDVATKQLRYRLAEKCPKIVRIYSEMLENQVFPIPRDYVVSNVRGRKYQLIPKMDQEEIALHYLIRKTSNPYSGKLKKYDHLFASKPAHEISDEEVEKYQKAVADASIAELKKYDVILCTCSVSASPRIKRGTNIEQLIIDESGMCMEPEVIVPLMAVKPNQIVLIGDHKQLRPIIKNQTAKDFGLDKSLFERYAEIYSPIMLVEQYRMHKEICAFPSFHFYDNKLQTVPTGYWTGQQMAIWPNRDIPVAFCHVNGEEKSLSVATEDGNEQSKSNIAECSHVIRIFMELINRLKVNFEKIAVLSQYKAQCKTIEKELKGRGYDKATVQTVVASQGDEWDYVILSTVRSMPQYEIEKRPSPGWLKRNLGFIIDQNQINVAITRARRGLIIVGNKHALSCDNHPETGFWGKLLWFYKQNGCVIDAKYFPRLHRDVHEREAIYQKVKGNNETLPPRLRKAAQREY